MTQPGLVPVQTTPSASLRGVIRAPGDKSISHRALIIAALATGRSLIKGLLVADDLTSTANALRQCGVVIGVGKQGDCEIDGVGIGGLIEAADVLDLGNSGTAVRLLMGVLASHPIQTIFSGDRSLQARPMRRVAEPLEQMGASVRTGTNGGLPVVLIGAQSPMPITYQLPVASAQVKSAILLAGLNIIGTTKVIESIPTRNHTENMLRAFGAKIGSELIDGVTHITLEGHPELMAQEVTVPGDPSSAAFPLVAALITQNSEVVVEGVGINETRTGLYKCLLEMGADIHIDSVATVNGEPIANITARSSKLKAVEISASRAPSMIDEYPILAAAAACADGTTLMHGLGELRIKESDRLRAIVDGLQDCGVETSVTGDTLEVKGTGTGGVPGSENQILSHRDHRIAMTFLTLGLVSKVPVEVDDGSMIDSSYPNFLQDMNLIGAKMACSI
ncbi:MAG: 3-phosphoshikimate 1-carboxyvinyltransferase [Rhodospirillaceae bacterium]|nr:3-phosphoshikimate 1-carboxyvinyltransferase [Rhodospirillaceae bacterium]